MATKTRAKDAVRAGSGKGGRRPPIKVKSGPNIPILPVAVGVALLLLAIGLAGYAWVNNRPVPAPATVDGIPCDQLEHTQVHYHAAVQIVYQGVVHQIEPGAGIVTDPDTGKIKCYYWLHVHGANENVIHVESPATQTFTLGQFFDVWSTWSQAGGGSARKLDATHVATLTVGPEQKLVVYIDLQDGKGPQPYAGNPRSIQLKNHEVITLEITPPDLSPPPSFSFTSGL